MTIWNGHKLNIDNNMVHCPKTQKISLIGSQTSKGDILCRQCRAVLIPSSLFICSK